MPLSLTPSSRIQLKQQFKQPSLLILEPIGTDITAPSLVEPY